MADRVTFELVSPEKIILSEEVELVVVPGTEGDFGVLPGHSPLISSIRPGSIRVYESGIVTQQIFIAGGFAEVTPERVTVLADSAIPVESLDRETIAAELARVTVELDSYSGDDAVQQKSLENAKRIATAQLEVLSLQ